MEVKQYMQQLGQQARAASRVLAAADSGAKNRALLAIAEAVDAARQTIADANKKDLQAGEAAGLDAALLHQIGDLAGDHAGFAGAGTGEHQQGAADVVHGFLLPGVESGHSR